MTENKAQSVTGKSGSSARLLLVDDEPHVLETLRCWLSAEGYDCETAATAEEAWELIQHADFSLLVTDIRLPGKSGIELLTMTEERFPDMAVVVITAVDDRETAIRALQLGAYGYVIKPLDENEVLINVVNALERRRLVLASQAYEHRLEAHKQLTAIFDGIEEMVEVIEPHSHELLETHERFTAIFDAIDEVVYVADPYSHELLYVNQAFRDRWGEGVGQKCYKVLEHKDEPCDFCTNDKILGEYLGREYIWEFQNLVTKEWFRCIDKAIRWPDGRMVRYEMAIDITGRKDAEDELREREENFTALADNLGDGLFILADDGVRVYANKRACEITEYSMAELLDMPAAELAHPPEREKLRRIYHDRMAGRPVPSRYEFTYARKDGTPVPVEISATVTTWKGRPADLVTFRDITARRRAEDALQEREENYTALAENLADGMHVISLEGKRVYANSRAAEMLGYSLDELLELDVLAIVYPDEREKVDRIYKDRMAGRPAPLRYETTCLRKDGTAVPVEISATLTTWRGRPADLVTFRDITQRRRAEEALRKARDELEVKVAERTIELALANMRLKELDQLKSMFIASMSHELRTPLNSIIGFTGIILQGMTGQITEEQRKQLTMVKNSANHLLALINDIIDVSKIEAGKVELVIEEFDLSALVQEAKDSSTVAADEKGLKVYVERPKRLVIKSDERRVKQVLINFVSNAVKFTDEGEIEIRAAREDSTVTVSVRDSGIGIRKEHMEKLFRAFSRIPAEGSLREGTGLGLYLSRKIADLLGGEVSAESEFGRGSKFTLTLPLEYAEVKT